MNKIFHAAALLILAVLEVTAQSSMPQVADGQTGSLALAGERSRTNMLIGSLNVANFYDNKGFSDNENRLGDFSWSIQPQLILLGTRRHLRWSFGYSPTITVDQRLPVRDLFAHNLGLDFQYQATRRLTVRLRDSLRVETHLLDRLNPQPFIPEFSVLDRPNDSVLTPIARRIYQEAGLDLDYLVGPRSIVGISGNFSQNRFRSLPDPTAVDKSLIDSQSEGARAFYSHHLSRRHSAGAMYQFQGLSFKQGDAGARVHTIFYIHSIALTPTQSLSLFVGPEFSRIQDQILVTFNLGFLIAQFKVKTSAAIQSLSGGATYGWQGKRTALRATWVRRISDGAGLFGASRLQFGSGELRRQLARRWTAGLGVGYGSTSALGLVSSSGAYRALSATGSISYALAEHLSMDFRYARLHQIAQSTSPSSLIGDHDQFSVSLSYQFAQPLGR
ncbi:MAG TPA: hypothetical protein VJK29_21675 [Terriglobales bacterium]|nr:hypothetical protein [Terriglobales bacterium]